MEKPNTTRRQSAKTLRDPEGKIVCSCGCGQHPKPPRRSWFSAKCVDEWREKNDPSYIRSRLQTRDRGICSLCGCDSSKEYLAWVHAHQEASRLISWLERREQDRLLWLGDHRDPDRAAQVRLLLWPEIEGAKKPWEVIYRIKQKWIDQMIPNPGWTAGRTSGWDADHIIPVVEGGGQCGLDNYRTLCHPCHKKETAALARRRAEQRRTAKTTTCQQPAFDF